MCRFFNCLIIGHAICTQDEKEFQTGICRDTLVDWGNFFRDVTIEWYTKNEIVIG